MKTNSTIDDLFKDGLNDLNFSGKEAAWKKLEQELNDKKRRRKRLVISILLFFVLSGIGFIALKNSNTHKIVPASPVAIQEEPFNSGRLERTEQVFDGGNTTSQALRYSNQSSVARKDKTSIAYVIPGHGDATAELADDAAGMETEMPGFIPAKIIADPALPSNKNFRVPAPLINSPATVFPSESVAVKTGVIKTGKFSAEIVAGSDIFNLNKKVGYYAGIRINKHLDRNTSVSAGINYSFNALNERYRLSSKPSQERETDAQINSLTMLRFPLLFQQQVPRTKFSLMAGLIPSYILKASVYNMPGPGSGDPTQYRRFTIHDVNRFNILFGAGIKYNAFKNLSFELSGNYGFTGLVKDAYINQSNVNDNFKNIQAGVVLKLK